MKISRRVGLILGAVILVAALATVWVIYFQQAGEQRALNNELSAAEDRKDELEDDWDKFEGRQTQAESSIDINKPKFPPVESIEYGEYLFEIADDCNVNLVSLSFPKPTDKKVGAVTYSFVSLALPVSGALADIFNFINTIRNDGRFASTEVKGANIVMGGGETTATVKIDIYGYKG